MNAGDSAAARIAAVRELLELGRRGSVGIPLEIDRRCKWCWEEREL